MSTEIAGKFALRDHGIDVDLFNRMLATLKPEDQKLLSDALDTVPWDRRAFIGKSIKPFLRSFEQSFSAGRYDPAYKQAYRGMIALFHAAALTRLPNRLPLMGLTAPQSEVLLQRVVDLVFFYPMYVSTAFTRNDNFVDAVCGAGLHLFAGGRRVHRREELIAKGRAAREAVAEPTTTIDDLDMAA